MHVQVRTSDGRIYDVDVGAQANVGELLAALFAPNPVPRNSSIMARTRLVDNRELCANVVHHDLFLVGPKPEQIQQQQQQQQQYQQQPQPNPYQQYAYGGGGGGGGASPSSSHSSGSGGGATHGHHGHRHGHHHHSASATAQRHHYSSAPPPPDPSLEHAKEAVSHLQEFVASPAGAAGQPQFNAPGASQQYQQQRPPAQHQFHQPQQQQQQHHQQDNRQHWERQQQQPFGGASPPPPPPPPPPQYQQQQQQQSQPTSPAPAPKKAATPADVLDEVRRQFDDYKAQSQAAATTHKERLWINEMTMKLLFRLDALDELPDELRAQRKALVRELQALQDWNIEHK